MASPFSIFRRYQATLLAVFGVALMVAFVILPAVIQMQQGGGRSGGYSSDAVLTWTGGEVTRNDISVILARRRHAGEFIARLQQAAAAKPGGKDFNPRRESGVLQQLARNTGTGAVENMLLVKKGHDMGMTVSNDAVENFLHRVTDNTFVSDEELRAEMRAAVEGTTLPAIYEALRDELLAFNVRQMALQGVAPTTPQEMMTFESTVTTPSDAWEYFNRLNRRVSAEFIPMKTEDFVGEVQEPSTSEVRNFYEKYKNDFPSPDSPQPGFRIPDKVEMHYVVADFNDYLQAAKPEVEDAEVKAYYEENKEDFRIFEEEPATVDEVDSADPRSDVARPPRIDDEGTPPSDADASDADTSDADTSDADNSDADDSDTDDSDTDDSDTDDSDTDDSDTDDSDTDDSDTDDSTDDDNAGDENANGSEPTDDAPAEEQSGETGDSVEEVPVDASEVDEADTTDDEPPSECGQEDPASDETEDIDAVEEVPVDDDNELPPVESTAGENDEDTATNVENSADDTGDASPDDSAADDDLTVPGREPKYRPFTEVEDEIRRQLASPIAESRMSADIAKAREALKEHYEQIIDFQAEIRGAKDPGEFDGEALADRLGLKFNETGMIDIYSLYEARDEHEIVQSSESTGNQRGQNFLALAFTQRRDNYQPLETQLGSREKVFVAWKVGEEEARVPELEEIRDEVVRAWKLQQARDVAKQAAQQLADRLSPNESLEGQVQSKYEVIAPPAFSYYDPISVMMMRFQGQAPRPGEIVGIEDASSDAIKSVVVQMPVNSIEVVSDVSKSTYYVVRLAGDESSDAEAREAFMQGIVDSPGEGLPGELQIVGQGERIRLFTSWMDELRDEYEVQQIDPDFFQRNQM